MKKFLIGLIGLVFVSGLVLAQSPAGEASGQILIPAREVLLHQIEGIRGFVQTIGAKSDIVTKADLKQLKSMVDNFFDLQERLIQETDAPLSIFTKEDASEVVFVFECREALDTYLDEGMDYQDNELQTVKRFFFKYTGREMTIKKVKDYIDRALGGFFLGVLIGLVIGFFVGLCVESEVAGFYTGVVVFVVCLLLSLLVL